MLMEAEDASNADFPSPGKDRGLESVECAARLPTGFPYMRTPSADHRLIERRSREKRREESWVRRDCQRVMTSDGGVKKMQNQLSVHKRCGGCERRRRRGEEHQDPIQKPKKNESRTRGAPAGTLPHSSMSRPLPRSCVLSLSSNSHSTSPSNLPSRSTTTPASRSSFLLGPTPTIFSRRTMRDSLRRRSRLMSSTTSLTRFSSMSSKTFPLS